MTPIAQADSDATLALEYGDVDHYGRPLLPVDPVKIARNLGLLVFVSELDYEVSGVLVKQNGGIPTIHLNVRDAPVRQRFSCAHELGHFWRRRDAVDNFGYIDKRDALASAGTDPEEIYANRFAAELLMPAPDIHKFAAQGAKPESLAARFVVSLDEISDFDDLSRQHRRARRYDGKLPVTIHGRYFMSRTRLEELRRALDRLASTYDTLSEEGIQP